MSVPIRAQSAEAKTPVHGYYYWMVEIAAVKVFIDHGVFEAIPADGSIAIDELAEKTNADSHLIERFSKFLVAAGVLTFPTAGQVAHNDASRRLAEPRIKLLYRHIFDFFMIPAAKWPEYFVENGLKEPVSSDRVPFGFAAGEPDKTLYQILETRPQRHEEFNRAMAAAVETMPITGMYDFSWIGKYAAASKDNHERPLFVDVGGGKGQALRAILKENPSIDASRCVLEDQSAVIDEAIQEADEALSKVAKVKMSIFEEQPVRGALVYHIRRVLNDWSDADCVKILSHLRNACVADSRILISEQLIPEQPSLDLAAFDIWMFNFSGKRRNEKLFQDIATKAGLRISNVSRDDDSGGGIIEMVPV
ncbi:hypothetical protein VHEMI09715 [[Torrubiella] hemipterigena]|uniref:O-methyltransferase C-terminal domain-containing protein n=1 Tax=[Torrubiella] hemipterigena TaxID=1531966 RepID=A0A0A1TAY2_9HYPO|nr:hypothetical protein VHEMI09715 [[Torrubiella] hemipterigena]